MIYLLKMSSIEGLVDILLANTIAVRSITDAVTILDSDEDVPGSILYLRKKLMDYIDGKFDGVDLSDIENNRVALELMNSLEDIPGSIDQKIKACCDELNLTAEELYNAVVARVDAIEATIKDVNCDGPIMEITQGESYDTNKTNVFYANRPDVHQGYTTEDSILIVEEPITPDRLNFNAGIRYIGSSGSRGFFNLHLSTLDVIQPGKYNMVNFDDDEEDAYYFTLLPEPIVPYKHRGEIVTVHPTETLSIDFEDFKTRDAGILINSYTDISIPVGGTFTTTISLVAADGTSEFLTIENPDAKDLVIAANTPTLLTSVSGGSLFRLGTVEELTYAPKIKQEMDITDEVSLLDNTALKNAPVEKLTPLYVSTAGGTVSGPIVGNMAVAFETDVQIPADGTFDTGYTFEDAPIVIKNTSGQAFTAIAGSVYKIVVGGGYELQNAEALESDGYSLFVDSTQASFYDIDTEANISLQVPAATKGVETVTLPTANRNDGTTEVLTITAEIPAEGVLLTRTETGLEVGSDTRVIGGPPAIGSYFELELEVGTTVGEGLVFFDNPDIALVIPAEFTIDDRNGYYTRVVFKMNSATEVEFVGVRDDTCSDISIKTALRALVANAPTMYNTLAEVADAAIGKEIELAELTTLEESNKNELTSALDAIADDLDSASSTLDTSVRNAKSSLTTYINAVINNEDKKDLDD